MRGIRGVLDWLGPGKFGTIPQMPVQAGIHGSDPATGALRAVDLPWTPAYAGVGGNRRNQPKRTRIRTLFAAAALLTAAPAAADTAERFAAEAVGSWTSVEQSVDPAYDWVESEVVRIWPEREDGVWLYQENAIIGPSPEAKGREGAKAAPYFQVIVQLRDLGGGTVHSTTWRVADRAAVRGAWAGEGTAFGEEVLGDVACMGRMQRVGEGFWHGRGECPNAFRGGVKVDSRSVRAPGRHVNWDRGFDAEGRHIWGPAEGGYIFVRKETAQ